MRQCFVLNENKNIVYQSLENAVKEKWGIYSFKDYVKKNKKSLKLVT